MNTNTKTEMAAVTATQSAVDAMAVVTLSPEKYAAEVYQPFKARLVAAIESVKAIDYDITTTAGMTSAIKCRATFRDLRIAADKERKARKEPITKIGKLLESGFDQVEERIAPLEELFDADIKAEEDRKEVEKAAKIAAERARTEAIEARIQAIRNVPLAMVGKSSAEILAARDEVRDTIITEELFGEQSYRDKAMNARSDALNALEVAFDVATSAEAAALAAEEARLAEVARIEQERAALAAQRAENDRIASEQAAERQRLANLAAAQEVAAAELRAKTEANLKAERDALVERERLANEAQAKAAADLKAAQDAHAAEVAAHAAKIKMDADHAEALEMNVQFDAAMARLEAIEAPTFHVGPTAADIARCEATAKAMLTNGRSLALPESYSDRDALIDAGMVDHSEGRIDELREAVRDLLTMHYTADEIRGFVEVELLEMAA